MKDVEGYEDYYSVTECGKVYSKRRGRFMKPGLGGGRRYRTVCLCAESVSKGFLVHRLVASAYIHNPLNKPEVNHKDGDRENNNSSNLEWVTRKENVAHAIETGLMKINNSPSVGTRFKPGYDPKRCKLSEQQVIDIRSRRSSGETYVSISRDYPVNQSNIRRACNGQAFKHII